jgi:inorganic pyrophosphatase
MVLVVETPKWNFIKIEHSIEGFKRAFISPLPTPFNYGYIEGTLGEDGAPVDVIILGERKKTGERLDLGLIGKVRFVDDNKRDDKYIASINEARQEIAINIFFRVYAIAKVVLGLILYRRWTRNRFKGIEWFQETIHSIDSDQITSV